MAKFRCESCQWTGEEPDWSDNTGYIVEEGEKPRQSIVPLCPNCGELIK